MYAGVQREEVADATTEGGEEAEAVVADAEEEIPHTDDGSADAVEAQLVEHETLPITPNLDIDDDADDEILNENGDVEDTAIMQKYLRAIQIQLQKELSQDFVGHTWLRDDILKENDWWIPKHKFRRVCGKLNVHFADDEMEQPYFRDVYVWLPDERWGKPCMPACPTCKVNTAVRNNGFHNKHFGRRIVALDHDYYCLSRRYRCNKCEMNAKELKKKVEDAAKENPHLEIQMTEKKSFERQYTFMAWNTTTLALYPHGYGSEFPAFLTYKAGVDRLIIDLMRPLFDKGLRPHSLADTILELHAKTYHRECLKHEMEIAKKRHLLQQNKPMLSEFADKSKYNGLVPTSRYLTHVYKLFHKSIQDFLDTEVKKRGAQRLHVDASYKEAKHLCQYHGQNLFKGLITITNEFAEIRMQFHVVTDDHEQFRPSLIAFAKTVQAYGQPDVDLVYTDNVVGDRQFYLDQFPSLREAQNRLDNLTTNSTLNGDAIGLTQNNDEGNACTIENYHSLNCGWNK